ncbi:MAG: beta-L-arabinofuranosidase domain-containing protein [Thermotogota bacterium]
MPKKSVRPPSEGSHCRAVPLDRVTICDKFWAPRLAQVGVEILPYQWEALNDRVPGAPRSHAFENLRIAAGQATGEFYGYVFQDSDIAKWLEAVGYSLSHRRNAELEALADRVIDVVAKAQQPDGYLDSYFTVKEPDKRWTNIRDRHEMYCAGHMVEAGVAYFEATGKRALLDVVCRLVDHIDSQFGPQPGKKRAYPGHEELELALVKLYRVTGEIRYLRLSEYFINERGAEPHYYDLEARERQEVREKPYDKTYNQSHLPVREQTAVVGHAVRAMYLYSGMADIAYETNDITLHEACRRLWENLTRRQMYLTGGIGSAEQGEAFTFDFDLPNDTAYTETCAAIGLVFWAHRMLQLDVDREYADAMERALYNGVLSGISLNGRAYFYVNPLEVWPAACEKRQDHAHVLPVRQPWFGCACCPPNVARLFASLGRYVYSESDDAIYVHLYVGSEGRFSVGGQSVVLAQTTDYPWAGVVDVKLTLEKDTEFSVALRLPGWCTAPQLSVNGKPVAVDSVSRKGYATITRCWRAGDTIRLELPMPVERIHARPEVREDAGRVALQRGPIVYCLEEVDNGPNLPAIALPRDARLSVDGQMRALGDVPVVSFAGCRRRAVTPTAPLYSAEEPAREDVVVRAIPYYAWGNRKPGEMLVWIGEV